MQEQITFQETNLRILQVRLRAKLGEYVERTSNAKLIISNIIIRSDDRLNSKIEATTSLLHKLCTTRKWRFIQHNNISKP